MMNYQVNDYITLQLEDKRTEIYINGEKKHFCKALLLNIDGNKEYYEVESIDQASRILEHANSLAGEHMVSYKLMLTDGKKGVITGALTLT